MSAAFTQRPALLAPRRIIVFRALMLGDWLCATPALRALRAWNPHAHIVLCGLPWTLELAERLRSVDEFLPFPGHPELPERRPVGNELQRFTEAIRQRRFDLALQMHGSGGIVNPLVAQFGASASAGFASADTQGGLDLAVPWPDSGPELQRCLALTDALGALRDGEHLDFPIYASDRRNAAKLLDDAGVNGRYVLLHPGSQLASRRWDPRRFALVADALAARGLTVVVTGSVAEATLAADVCAAGRRPFVNFAGRTSSLFALGALVERAALVISNDTGISHIAAALQIPSVVVASGSDVARWAPLNRTLHRVHWHWTPCRPCAHPICPTGHECAAGVAVRDVLATALAQIGA